MSNQRSPSPYLPLSLSLLLVVSSAFDVRADDNAPTIQQARITITGISNFVLRISALTT